MKPTLGVDLLSARLAIEDADRFFVVAGWQQAVTISLLNLLIALRRRFAIWTDTPNLDIRRSFQKATVRRLWLRYLFWGATYVMGTGAPALAALEQMGCRREKLVNFPFFVDLENFRPEKSAKESVAPGRPLVFLSSGRLSNALKGYDLAIRALAVAGTRTNREYRYLIAGEGPDKAALQALARSCGIESRVEFRGWLEPRELSSFYRSGDIFLHPSQFDPFPNAVLEAMASGLPIIGSDAAGSVVDRVVHGHNGFIHRCNNLEDLTAQLTCAMTNPAALAGMGREARATAETWPASKAVATLREIALPASAEE
ncbi:MAG: glycosyltransferase family 4 protein [Chthoniobacterales bacterium]